MERFFMDQLWQLWQTLGVVWSSVKTELSGHLLLAAASVVIVVLFWFFISPGIKNR